MIQNKKRNWKHFQVAFCPNFVVLVILAFAGYTSLVFAFPRIIQKSSNRPKMYFYYSISIFIFLMFLVCWSYTALADPGRITDDLQQRGLLDEVKRGDIPFCLRNLPICEKCNVPKPKGSVHCNICDSCHLRHDHHCGVVGQCIADKNTKSFILSLFYAFIFSIISAIICFQYTFKLNYHSIYTLDQSEILVFVAGIYCALFSLYLGSFSISMVFNQAYHVKKMRNKLNFSNFIKLFGDKWYKMFWPVQKESTCYAWADTFWFDEFEL